MSGLKAMMHINKCSARVNLLLVVVVGSLTLSRAYAPLFHGDNVASSCFDHPSKPIKGHLSPTLDQLTSITVSAGDKPVTALCPGESYTVEVSFAGNAARSALVTVSQGTFAESNVPRCSNAITTVDQQLVNSLKATWQISCGMMGRVELKTTSGTAETGNLAKTQLGLPVMRISDCPVNKCTPATASAPAAVTAGSDTLSSPALPASAAEFVAAPPSTSTPAAATAASAVTESAPSTVADSIAAAAPSAFTLSSSGSACDSPSKLGYQCCKEVADGITVHYSLGGPQPDNPCTKKSSYDNTLAGPLGAVLHIAIDSDMAGYVGLGIPSRPGRMVPADVVIGSIDDKSGVTKVDSYYLTSQSAAGVQPSASAWATGVGAVRKVNLTSNSYTTTVCFSRPATAAAALASSSINPAVVPLIWSAHTSPEFTHHAKQGSLVINMISGTSSSLSTGAAPTTSMAAVAHGVLMSAAFFLLMPTAMLVARHKWLCGDEATSQLSKSWSHLHTSLQAVASAAVVAGFILAMTMFYRANGSGAGIHRLYSPHFGLGVAVVALSVLQLLVAAVQPGLRDARRGLWKAGHCTLGWVLWSLGIVNSFFGVVLMHEVKHLGNLVTWLVPLCVMLGLLLLGGMIMEVPKHTLQSQGYYDPRIYTYNPQPLDPSNGGKKVQGLPIEQVQHVAAASKAPVSMT